MPARIRGRVEEYEDDVVAEGVGGEGFGKEAEFGGAGDGEGVHFLFGWGVREEEEDHGTEGGDSKDVEREWRRGRGGGGLAWGKRVKEDGGGAGEEGGVRGVFSLRERI